MRHAALSALGAFVLSLLLTPFALAAQQGQLVIWINGDKGYNGLQAVGDRFAKDLGVKVTVEHPENPTDKFMQAAQAGTGPDIFIWAHDRLGEYADAGLLAPVNPSDAFKAKYNETGWRGATHKGRVWGYPIALESIGLIYNKAIVPQPPRAMEELFDLNQKLKAQNKNTIMWDYTNTYFTWPFLAANGGYVFGQDAQGNYITSDIGVNHPGAVRGLELVVALVRDGVLPEGTTYSVMESKMNAGQLAMMISGPWAWSNLKKSKIDFGFTTLPTVAGKPAVPFVGIMTAMVNRNSKNKDLAIEFLENYVLVKEGLQRINDDVPLGVPALNSYANEMAQDPLIAGLMDNIKQGKPMPNVPEMGRFWSAMQPAIANATSGKATPKEALDNAAQRIRGK